MAPVGGTLERIARQGEELPAILEAWSPAAMAQALASCDLVLLPDPGPASRSRLIGALHAGRFCVARRSPHHDRLGDYAWVGEDFAEGIRWSLSHAAEVLARLAAAQRYLDEVHAPADGRAPVDGALQSRLTKTACPESSTTKGSLRRPRHSSQACPAPGKSGLA